jgi:hypothetical protein
MTGFASAAIPETCMQRSQNRRLGSPCIWSSLLAWQKPRLEREVENERIRPIGRHMVILYSAITGPWRSMHLKIQGGRRTRQIPAQGDFDGGSWGEPETQPPSIRMHFMFRIYLQESISSYILAIVSDMQIKKHRRTRS